MKSRKLASIVIACALIVSSTCSYIPSLKVAAYGNLITDDFETGLNGWGPRGESAEVVALSSEEAYSGVNSVKISNRTNTWHGATCDKTKELTLGETYVFGIMIKYVGDSYSSSQKFSLQLQYNDGVNDQYKTIKTAAVNKGVWTLLQGEYTIPTDAANVFVYVETEYKTSPAPQDLLSFYIDDFTATPAVLPEIEQDIPSLKDVFRGYFKVGGAAQASEIAPAPAKDLFLKHYNSLTFGNELKPDSVLDYNATIAYMESSGGNQVNPQVNIRAARTLLEFARDNHIPVRGHTLVWHNQTPDWFFRVDYSTDTNAAWASKEVMLKRLENYIKNLMELLKTSYPTVEFYAWDVVNEAVDPNTATGMRNPGSNNVTSGNSLWMLTVGEEYIEKAFSYARIYAPEGCKLFYNDYNEYEDKKSTFIYNILVNLKNKNLVDGMGMQSHWTMDYPSVSMFESAVRKYNTLGLEIQLTEVDMKQPDNSQSALTAQANRYKSFIDKAVSLKKEGMNITAVIFWGVTDRTSWLSGYPLLFNGDYKAKSAFYSIISEITPTGTPAPTVTPTPIVSPTPSVTPTPTVSVSPTPTINPTPTVSVTPTPSIAPTTIPLEGKPAAEVVTKNNGNYIGQSYTITAKDGSIDLSQISLSFTAAGMSQTAHNFWCDQASLQLNAAPWYVSLGDSVSGKVENGALTIHINKSTVLSEGTGKFIMDIRFAKTDWSVYETLSNPVLKVYYKGSLVE